MKTINVTNPSAHGRTGLLRACIPFALGEVANESALQGWTVNWRGADVPTYWTAVGAAHRDGSVRYAQAEWRGTVPGDGAAVAPTVVAQVVERANTAPPAASFPLATVFGNLGLTVSYTDPENGQSYSADVLARARAGTNNATLTTTDAGGRRLVRAEGYMGRGQHHEALRAGGWNTNTAAVLTDGNLHVRTWWEFGSGDTFGTLTILFANDAAYPTPSQPLDGSGRATPTDPGVLDDPLQRHIENLRVTFDDPSGTLHWRSWWTDSWDEGHGRGMWGRTQAVNGTGYRVWSMPIEGLAADQSWGVRFSFARSAGEASVLARFPYAFQGMPTQDTWRAAVRSGSLPGSWSSDSVSISGGWMFPLIEVDQAQLDAWFQRGPTVHAQVMNGSIHGTLGSANTPNLDPWNLLGAKYAPSGGSTGRNYGGFQEGAIHLTGSPWELYYYVGAQLREFTARHGWIWGMEHQPRTWVGQPSQETCWYKGSALRPESFNRWGRYTGAHDQNAPRPQYRGSRARDDNPQAFITYGDSTVTVDTSDNSFNTTVGWLRVPEAGSSIQVSGFRSFANNVGTFDVASATATKIIVRPRGTQTLRDGETPGLTIRIDAWPWNQFDSAHHGIRPLALVALWTQDPVFLDLVGEHGREQALWYCEHTYSNTSAGGESWRSNWRPLMILYHAWLVTGESYFADSASRRIDQWIDGPVSWRADVPGPPHPGPSGWVRCVGTFKGGASQLYQACDGPPETRVNTNTEIAPWQHSLATPFLLSLGFDFAVAWGTAAERAVSVVHSSVRAVLMGASAINPTRISAAAAGLLDACWGSAGFDYRRTLQPRQSAPDLTTDWGWCRNQLVADYGGTHGEFFDVLASLTNWIYSFGSGNAGENTNHNFTLETYKAFADLRADAGLVERADFLTAGLRSFFPRLLQGADYDSQFGFAIDSYLATNDPPTVAFIGTPLVGNAPLEVAFDATASRIPSGTRGDAVARWWFRYSPGDEPDAQAALGTAEAILTPIWTYDTAGTFTVRLEIEDSLGQTAVLERTDYVTTSALDPPVAWIVGFPTSGYAPLEVAFQSTGGGGRPSSWAWDFGDGNTSTEEHPIHEYTTPGIYDVTLVVENAAGADTMTRYEYVTALAVPQTAPVASFTLDVAAGTAPLTVTITNTSTNLVAPSYLWDFGDGEGSGEADPGTHTYTDAGSYTLSLTIVDVGGTSYAQAQVVVSASPVSVTVVPEVLRVRSEMPAPSVETGHALTLAPLALASRILPPTVTTNLSAVSPVAVERVHVLYTAAPLSLVSEMPAPAVAVGITVTPPDGPLALAADLPTPLISTNTSTSVEVTVPPLKLASAMPAPAVAVDVTIVPAADALSLVSGIPAPTIETGRRDPVDVIYTAAPLALASDLPAPAVTGDCNIVPDVLEHFLALLQPVVSSVRNATFTPAAPLRLFGTFPAPTVTTGDSVTVTVEPLALVAAIPDPTVMTSRSTTVVPAPLALVADFPAPTVLAGTSGEVFLDPLGLTATLLTPSVYANETAAREVVSLVGSVRMVYHLEGSV